MKKIAALIVLIGIYFTLYAQSSDYKIVNRFHLDGDEGWDMIAVDEATGRIFVSHGSMAQVRDETRGLIEKPSVFKDPGKCMPSEVSDLVIITKK